MVSHRQKTLTVSHDHMTPDFEDAPDDVDPEYYWEGYEAAKHVDADANHYPPGSDRFRSWYRGWYDYKEWMDSSLEERFQ